MSYRDVWNGGGQSGETDHDAWKTTEPSRDNDRRGTRPVTSHYWALIVLGAPEFCCTRCHARASTQSTGTYPDYGECPVVVEELARLRLGLRTTTTEGRAA